LAPTGTKFDHMWFSGISSGLTLFDGTFPAFPPFILPTSLTLVNEYASLAGDPTSTLANKINIPVLDQTPSAFQPPSTFQLLAPHQDLQFTGDRPFFFEDGQRAFICHLDRDVLQLPDRSWMNGNLATAQRADFFPLPNPQPLGVPPGQAASSLTVLVPGPGGQRIAQELAPVDLTPAFSPRTLLPTSVTLHRYTFLNFHHPYLCEFVKALDSEGIPALMSYETQSQADAQSFDVYGPEPIVLPPHPSDEVEFQSGGAYELYNWELFFHIPLLIATRLSQNQRFEDAQRWFHYIFNPSGNSGSDSPQNIVQRYWNFKPFHDRASADYEAQSVKAIETMAASGPSEELK